VLEHAGARVDPGNVRAIAHNLRRGSGQESGTGPDVNYPHAPLESRAS